MKILSTGLHVREVLSFREVLSYGKGEISQMKTGTENLDQWMIPYNNLLFNSPDYCIQNSRATNQLSI